MLKKKNLDSENSSFNIQSVTRTNDVICPASGLKFSFQAIQSIMLLSLNLMNQCLFEVHNKHYVIRRFKIQLNNLKT